MAKESCLQVLAYYALMKPTNPALQYIGFVLPMQREVTVYDLGRWDLSKYLQILTAQADKLAATTPDEDKNIIILQFDDKQDTITFDINTLTNKLITMGLTIPNDIGGVTLPVNNYKVGNHIAKGKHIASSIRNYITTHPGLPCQMFLANPRTGKRDAKTTGQIAEAAQVIRENKVHYFTHAPYVINLCANQCDNGNYWQQQYLNEDLDLTASLGGKGVIVHTGARKDLSEGDALIIMEYMIRQALSHATEECPLLLETPCGEGTEIVTRIEDFGNFFSRFSSEERKRLGICADSCHILSAGYDPLQYLQHWEKYCSVPIRLVHFNDSQGKAGCCTDRHASPGYGHIGMDKMVAIANWCTERNIPMIVE
jgi:deoxyribonuclease-4